MRQSPPCDQIQQYIEQLISRAATISTLAVLRILQMTHKSCSALIEDLKTYDSVLSGGQGPNGNNSNGTSGLSSSVASGPSKVAGGGTGSGSGSAPGSGGTLATMLDHAMEEMFVPWLEGSRYLESESKNLVELFAGLLSRFTRYHVSFQFYSDFKFYPSQARGPRSESERLIPHLDFTLPQETVLKAKPNSLLDRVVHQLSSSSSSSSSPNMTSSSTASAAAAAISKYANVFTSSAASASKALSSQTIGISSPTLSKSPAITAITAGGGTGMSRTNSNSVRSGAGAGPGGEDRAWSSDGVLTVAMAERMLRWHAEAVGRILELSISTDV